MKEKNLLEMRNISIEFPGVKALDNVDIDLKRGEVLAIVGENGAGKSTLIKILSGSYHCTNEESQIKLDGEIVNIKDTNTALNLSISTVYQETALVSDLTVAENIFIGRQPTKLWHVNWKKMIKDAGNILDTFSIMISPRAMVSELSASQNQLIEMAKAFSHKAKIMILDEPTASITDKDTDNLFNIIQKFKKQGVSVIYITHRIKEIFRIADRVIVLRDGKLVKKLQIKDTTEKEIASHMIGREIGSLFGEEKYKQKERVVLKASNISRLGKFKNINFDIKENEILGLFGLVGSGRTEIIKAIFGVDKIDSGEIILNDEKISNKHPFNAIQNGFAYVTEDRRTESIIQSFSIRENISILFLKEILNKIKMIDIKKEKKIVKKEIEKFSIKASSTEQLAMNLSGGNQQKVALAKVLSIKPKILILDEPTKGIDVGAKKEIHQLIKNLANSGVSVLLISSELPEILAMSHRIMVIKEGESMGIFNAEDCTEESLLYAAIGIE